MLNLWEILIFNFVLLSTFVNGFVNKFTKWHIGLMGSNVLCLFVGKLMTLYIFMVTGIFCCLVHWDYIYKSYTIIKKTSKNVLKLSKLSKDNVSKKDEEVLKLTIEDLEWYESNIEYVSNKYNSFKMYFNSYLNTVSNDFSNTELQKDCIYYCNFASNMINCACNISYDMASIYVIMFEEVPYIGKYLTVCKKYYIFNEFGKSDYLDKDNDNDNNNNNNNNIQLNIMEQLDTMNSLMGMVTPLLNSSNNNLPDMKISDINMLDISSTNDMEAMMATIFKDLGKIPQQQNNSKISLKKKRDTKKYYN
jgi:hypothetical protein